MRVGIVTVYNSINSGSYWQAYALGEVIKRFGHEVVYIKRPISGSSASKLRQIKVILKTTIKCGVGEGLRYLKSVQEFAKAQKRSFDVYEENSDMTKDIDLFVIGSDTVWNFRDNYFSKWIDIYTGKSLPTSRTLSYAASAANTNFGDQEAKYKNVFANYKAISVRDKHTQQELKKLTGIQAKLVCDPTLLLTKEDSIFEKYEHINEKYILLYMFQRLNGDQEKTLIDFAGRNQYKIINFMRKEIAPYANVHIVNTPDNFCKYAKSASLIVTDTYHGTLFSFIFQKKLVVINRGKVTVNSIMDELCLTDHLVDGDEFAAELERPCNYDLVNDRISKIRNESYTFLKKNLES